MISLRGLAIVACGAGLIAGACTGLLPAGATAVDRTPPPPPAVDAFCLTRLADPPRTRVERPCGTARAMLTDDARSVVLVGPKRRFEEATAKSAVVTTAWVRVLPAPFTGTIDVATTAWLNAALADARPDILALSMQYIAGAPPLFDDHQVQIAGDADYGPPGIRGARREGADFNDYLGQPWSFADGKKRRPRGDMLHSLDCSGFIRMIWGFRAGLPMAHAAVTVGDAIPRRAAQMNTLAPGVVIIARHAARGTTTAPPPLDRLQPGDLVFFDADPSDGTAIDHVGIYLDKDLGGHLRFISSRKGANGPTLGDEHGASLLDGTGLYARSFRSARRL